MHFVILSDLVEQTVLCYLRNGHHNIVIFKQLLNEKLVHRDNNLL
jgi:hypothetical protein